MHKVKIGLLRSKSFSDIEEKANQIFKGKEVCNRELKVILSNGKSLKGKDIVREIKIGKDLIVYEVKDSSFFREAVLLAKGNNKNGDCLAIRDTKEYDNARLFITKNGEAGVAVEKDGHIFSLYKNANECKKNGIGKVGAKMMCVALANGGDKLDCFDGYLPRYYCTLGFQPVTKTPFKIEFTGGGHWDFSKKGKPSLIFMKHNGDSIYQILQKKKEYPKLEDYNIKSSVSLEVADRVLGRKSTKKRTLDRAVSMEFG